MQNGNWLFEAVLGTGVAIFPSIGFIYQYRLIYNRKSVGTFSINVCGVMFLSNLLRIAFFIYKEFSIALLIQSILNITTQAFLLYLCVKTMISEGYFQKQVQNADSSWFKTFWKWKEISYYFIVVAIAAVIILGLGAFIKINNFEFAGQTLGYTALIAETFLLIPQIIQNLKQERAKGISYIFITLNTLQDLLELIFVIIYSQPLQFLIFNLLQVITNGLLILQIAIYKNCHNKRDQNDQQNKMVDHKQSKHYQIQSGHHIYYPFSKPANETTKNQQFPLKVEEGQIIDNYKQPLQAIVE